PFYGFLYHISYSWHYIFSQKKISDLGFIKGFEYFQTTYDSFMGCLKEHSKIAKIKEFILDFQ
ncbi:unnamed protein product, partial [marine sediment metagenome]